MKYALLLYSDESGEPDPGSAEFAGYMQEWFVFTQALEQAGAFVAGEALEPVATATSVRRREGRTITADGPFAETKETLGGFYIIDVADLDEAITWAEKIPNVGRGTVEVRPVPDYS